MATVPDPTTSALSAARYALAGQYDPTPDSVRASDFERWPVSVQAAFVRAFAGGASPASILVGRANEEKAIATLSAGGGDVAITRAPSAIDTAPGALDVATFMDWPNEVQVFYARANGSGVPTAVTIGPAGATVTATVTRDAFGNAAGVSVSSGVDASLFGKLPDTLSAAAFFALLPSEQGAYVRKLGQIDPNDATRTPSLAIAGAGAGGTPIRLDDGGRAFTVVVPAGTYPGFATPLTGQTSAVTGGDFARWPREVRRAYVEAQPGDYPKTVILAGSDDIASIGARGGDVDTVAIPNRFNRTPDAAIFLEWPAAAQVAYARRNAENPANPQPLVLAGRHGQTLAVALAPAPAGITLAAAPPVPGPRPADVDLDLFQLWPTAAQVAYLAANGSLTPKSLVLGSNDGLLTLGAGGMPEIDPFPAAFGASPASLAPATFLTWSPAFQALYLDRRGTTAAGTRSVTVGNPAGLALTVSAAVAGGVTGAVRVTSDSLRIASSKAMDLKLADPTDNIYGSGGQNLDPNRASALAAFPLLTNLTAADFPDEPAGTVDTSPAVLAQFAKLPSALTAEEFRAWNPATRAAYLIRQGSAAGTSMKVATIGSGDATITAFVQEPGGKAHIIDDGKQGDILRMSVTELGFLASKLTAAQFGQWHTAAQIAYLKRNGDNTKGNSATIGTGSEQITAFVGAGGTKVYRVEDLQKTDIGKMALADQKVLSALPAFIDKLAQTTGLTSDGIAAKKIVTDLENAINAPGTVQYAGEYIKGGDSQMPAANKKIFLDSLSLIKDKIDKGAVFSIKEITDQANEIKARFERANCFAANLYRSDSTPYVQLHYGAGNSDTSQQYKVYLIKLSPDERIADLAASNSDFASARQNWQVNGKKLSDLVELPSPPRVGEYQVALKEAITLDGVTYTQIKFERVDTVNAVLVDNNSVRAAYNVFIEQEQQLLNLARKRMSLAEGIGGSQTLDVPNLVYLFQLYANLAGEAKIRADTEEINQTNELLKTYGVIQNVVNATLKQFDPKLPDDKKYAARDTNQDFIAVEIFKRNTPRSPIEMLRGFERPTDSFGEKKADGWRTYGSQLADHVALLNQESQIKMNEVNSQTKAKDRNFDLANNALSKMNEILQKIAST